MRGLTGIAKIVAGAVLALALGCAVPVAADDSGPPILRGDLQPGPDETVVVEAQRLSDNDYRLGANDKLHLTVYGEDDLSGDFQVDSSGMLRIPLIGDMKVAGMTAHDLETFVENQLGNGYLKDPRVSVEVTQYRPVYVIGEVNKPGPYSYAGNMSALNAIALAGGFTEKAVESTVYIRHEGDTEEQPVSTDQLTRIRPGDVLRVKETAFWNVADVVSPLTGLGYFVNAFAT